MVEARRKQAYARPMSPADDVWNRAAHAWDPNTRAGFLAGDIALAGLLAFHGVAMNGGVLHALEMADDQMLQEALDGYRFFSFGDVAAMLGDAYLPSKGVENMLLPDAEALERELDGAYSERIPNDQTLADAFESHFAAHQDHYAPVT
jgi:hypothetical protein